MNNQLLVIYRNLLDYYGSQNWWPGEGLEIAIGAVLTQQTSWRNVEKALEAAKACLNAGRDPLMALARALSNWWKTI